MKREAARTALLAERLSAGGAEAALLLAGEAGTVQVGGTLRVTHYGAGDYEVRRAWHVDAGGDSAVAVPAPAPRPALRLIQGGAP